MTASDEHAETETPAPSVAAPFLRIQRGNPDDEQIAALVAVLSAAASATGPEEIPVRDNWGRPSSMHRPEAAFSPYAFGTGVRGHR
ncbi:MAG: acyl-CoA carboxylase epsilon subunit [Rhodococcus sp. (in: high G+C Gram-positive bacteria)]